jgi:chromosome segregation ATPase
VKSRFCAPMLLVLLSGLSVAQSEKISLADLAKPQEPAKKARVVITNDDIPMANTEAEFNPAAPDHKRSENSSSDSENRDDAKPAASLSDRENVAALKEKIDKLADQQNMYKAAISQLEEKLSKAETEFRIDTYNTALANNRESLQIVTNQREQAEKVLAGLQEKMKPQQKAATPN